MVKLKAARNWANKLFIGESVCWNALLMSYTKFTIPVWPDVTEPTPTTFAFHDLGPEALRGGFGFRAVFQHYIRRTESFLPLIVSVTETFSMIWRTSPAIWNDTVLVHDSMLT